MRQIDLKEEKSRLRRELKEKRRTFSEAERAEKDAVILRKLSVMPAVAAAGLMLCYISTPLEADTRRLLSRCFSAGILVAAPRVDKDKAEMMFYYINSLEDTISGLSGISGIAEPKRDRVKVTDYSGSVCVVPALGYNRAGYRLGYGGGYYDRFLADYAGLKIGLCYREFITDIPVEEHDVKVDMVITD